jgi:S-formylglutathione hydrolase FrmB
MKRIFCFLLLFYTVSAFAASVDTITIYSNSMKKNIRCVVITPDSYKTRQGNYPVVYLLHGYSGDYSNYIKKIPGLKQQSDNLQLVLVCPDGGYAGWYFDSPVDSSKRYETYISKEVPAYIDSHYHTIKNKHGRAIAGLSMGGHGALFLGLRHPQFFGACGSMSGGVDLISMYEQFGIKQTLGDSIINGKYWKDYSVMNIIETYKRSDDLAILIDCGVSDFMYPSNHQLHDKMLQLKIPHDYIERPGEHNWDYWANAVKYQLFFFRNYFDRYK